MTRKSVMLRGFAGLPRLVKQIRPNVPECCPKQIIVQKVVHGGSNVGYRVEPPIRSGYAAGRHSRNLSPLPSPSSPEAASLDEPRDRIAQANFRAVPRHPHRNAGWLSFAAVCLFWGTSSPLLRFTVRYVSPLWLVTIRFFVAGSLLWLLLTLVGRRPNPRGISRVLVSGVALTATNLLVTLGFQRVEAGVGTLLLATTAVAFAVVDRLWPGGSAKPSATIWLGLLLGLFGVGVLVLTPSAWTQGTWQGYAMLTLSTWTWAVGGVAQARHPSGLDPLQSSAWQMLIAGTLVAPFAYLVGGAQLHRIPIAGWLGIGALVITASIIAFVCFIHMLQTLPAYIAGTYTYVNAVVAAALSVLWLGEQLTPRFYLAAALVLGGVALIQQRVRRAEE